MKLSWSVRLKIIRDIVSGMVYLVSKNVFHRDLNPKVRFHGDLKGHGVWWSGVTMFCRLVAIAEGQTGHWVCT